jgi:hypothetical protein
MGKEGARPNGPTIPPDLETVVECITASPPMSSSTTKPGELRAFYSGTDNRIAVDVLDTCAGSDPIAQSLKQFMDVHASTLPVRAIWRYTR